MARKPTDTVALQVRLPEGLRRKLAQAADKSARSLNSEIVWRLGQSLGDQAAVDQHEANEAEGKRRRQELEKIVDEILAKRGLTRKHGLGS